MIKLGDLHQAGCGVGSIRACRNFLRIHTSEIIRDIVILRIHKTGTYFSDHPICFTVKPNNMFCQEGRFRSKFRAENHYTELGQSQSQIFRADPPF